ncbi:MAG: ROK family protein, partial [Planctomycetes bacterium]|nr:ROK family protein [Planctomycetota bacterium]
GKGCSHFVFYDIGEGIGAAPVIDDMLYRGRNTLVAEVGHITVDMNGKRCSCGNRGCLELYASMQRLRERFNLALSRRPQSYEKDLAELFRLRAAGDETCVKMVEEHAAVVSVGAVSLANMFSPERIIVGAYDCESIDLEPFVKRMRADISGRAFAAIRDRIEVESSRLGPDIMAFGGAALVLTELLSDMSWLYSSA